MMHTLKKNKAVHMELGTGKDVRTQGKKASTGHVGFLSIGQKRARTKACFYISEWKLKDGIHETAFLNKPKDPPRPFLTSHE